MTNHRHKRWDLLDHASDPIPWDSTSAAGLKTYYDTVSDAAHEAANDIRKLDRGDLGKGATIDALKELVNQLPKLLDEASDSYGKAHAAFRDWETALEDVRTRSLTVVENAAAAYDALEDKEDWDKDDAAPKHGYVSDLNAVLGDMETAVDKAVNALDEAQRGFGRKLWDFWNEVVEWIEENPLVYAVAMIVAGIAAIFIPGIGFAIALGVFSLLVSATQLHRDGKLGFNLETFVTLGLDVLSVVPGAVALRGGRVALGAMGRGATRVANRVPGLSTTSLRNGAHTLRTSRAGTTVTNVVNRTGNTMRSIREGTFVGPKTSLAVDTALQVTRDTAIGTAGSVAVNAAAGNDIDLGQELLTGFATNVLGSGFNVANDHNLIGSGPLVGTGENGVPPLGVNTPGADPSQGSLAGVDTDFSSDGPSRVTTPEGVTTVTTDPSSGTTLDTTAADGTRMSTTVDPSGGLSSASVTGGEPGSVAHFQVDTEPNAGSTSLTSGENPVTTIVSGDASVSTGDFGEIRFDRSQAAEPSVLYTAPSGDPENPGLTLDVRSSGEAVVGGDTNVRTDATTLQVNDSGGGVTVPRGESGRANGLDLTNPDGTPGASYRDGQITVPDGAGGTTVTRDASGTDIASGGLDVRTPRDAGEPVAVSARGADPTQLRVGTDGPQVVLSPDGAGPSVVRDPDTGRTASVDGQGHTVSTGSGAGHDYRADTGTVRASDGGSDVTATGAGVSTGRDGGGRPEDSVRLDLSASGEGSATAAGANATVAPDGTAAYRHDATGATAHRTADGDLVSGSVTVSPDGTVRGPDFVRNPDGSLSVSDGQGGRRDYTADGTPVPSGGQTPTPPLRTDPATGQPVFTSRDGTTVAPGAGLPVRTGEGMTLHANGGDVTLTAPPNTRGESLSVTHTRDGGVRMEAGGHRVGSGRDGVEASAPNGYSSVRSPDGTHTVRGGGLDTSVSPDGTARTTDDAAGGGTVAEHSAGTGTVRVTDGVTVSHGDAGRMDVTRGGDDVTLTDGQRNVTVSGERTEVRDGTAADGWSVGSGPGREVHGGTGPDHRITSRPQTGLSSRMPGGRGDDVSFTAGDGISGHQTGAGRTTVTDRSGTTIGDTRSGVRVDGGDGGPNALIQPDGIRVTSPEGQTHRIGFDENGRPSRVDVNDIDVGHQTLHSDGRAVSDGENGTVTARPDGFTVEGSGRTVTADDSGATYRRGGADDPDAVRIRHGRSDADGHLHVDRDGVSQSFGADGPTRQERGSDAPRPVNQTEPRVTRDGNAYTVENSYQRHASAPVVNGPTMTRDPSTGESGVTSPHGFSATQSNGTHGGRDTEVRVSEGAPTVTRRDDGETTVEGERLRVSGTGSVGERNHTVEPRGSGPSLTRGPGRDGAVHVADGPDTLVRRDADGGLTGPDGQPLTPDADGPRVVQQGDNRVRVEPDGEVRVTGRDGTSVVLRPDGGVTYRSGGETVDFNRNGLPTTRVDRDGAQTTVRESGNRTLEIHGRREDGGVVDTTRTHIGDDGAVESRINRTGGAENESWGVGVDFDGRTNTRNYRVRGEESHQLSADGNLTSGHWGHKTDLADLSRDLRTARESGDQGAIDRASQELGAFRRDMSWTSAFTELRAVAFNALGGLALDLMQGKDLDVTTLATHLSTFVGNGYQAMGEGRLIGQQGVPEGGAGQLLSRTLMKTGGAQMANDLKDGFLQEFDPEAHELAQQEDALKHLEEGRLPPPGQLPPEFLADYEHLSGQERIEAMERDLKARIEAAKNP
ncbi:hypothetical protein [Nocardiopsis halotolerans]|uniref:hypothetical protein n=1 Tax=Nocardiopsis halotolerans TaxID=124252 RepID=UPI0003453A2E|nr:hypothetical protein [Nocardiopsis halotolerans]